MNYAIDDSNGTQITAGLPPQTARKVAQRMADERGMSVFLYEIPAGEEEAEEIAPSPVTVIEVGDASPTRFGVTRGLDVDITIKLGELSISGALILVPYADKRQNGRYVAYGASPDTWLSSSLFDPIRRREDLSEILTMLEDSGSAACEKTR